MSEDVADAVATQLDRFGRERLDARTIDREARIPPGILEELADLGIFGLTLPEDQGGSGLSLEDACKAVRALARHDRSVATTVGLHLGLGTRALVAYGTPSQRSILADLASGTIASFAATEPGAGSDLSAVSTRAVDDGGLLRVDGQKAFVTNGGFMGVVTVLAVTPGRGGRRGHGLVVLRRSDKGLTVGEEEHKLGLRGSSTTPLYLDGVRVDADRVVGAPGAGLAQAEHVLSWGRTLMSSGCLGTADAALDKAIAHVRQRRQFRRPLVALEVVREQLAHALALRRAMEATVFRAARGAMEVDNPRQVRLSMVAKVLASDGAWQICDLAVQLHGGLGFIEESGLPLLLRDSRITRIFEGANDVLLVRLGALEATSPWESDHPVAAEVARLRNELSKVHGAGLLLRQGALHRLGRAVVQRESVLALEGDEDDLARLWVAHASRNVSAPPADARITAIAERHLDAR